MSYSKLATERYPAYSGNYTKGRDGRKIEAVTIHHMASVLTAKECGAIFQRVGRQGSSHYGIGRNGEIASYVDEENTAWTNSNWDSNCKSVTIETSNSSTGGQWPVSDKVLNSLIKLVADIGKRNNLGTLVKGKNVTWHSMFANTACPGPYLLSKMDYIISEANKINSGNDPKDDKTFESYVVEVTVDVLNVRNGAGTNYKVNTTVRKGERYTIVDQKDNWGKLKSGAGWICLDYTKRVEEEKFKPYKVKVTANVLNVRAGAGTNYKVVTTVKKNEIYTIVDQVNNWGKLKSGVGYICLDYTVRV
jgi:uncharacterized protein YgiM (DUF1202 family)